MNEEQMIVKDALEFVAASGTTGVLKSKLLSALRTADGQRLSPEQEGAVFSTLVGRCWIVGHMEPVWHNTRWCLTVNGSEALSQMS